MLTNRRKFAWKGSMGSLGEEQRKHRTSEEPDLLNGVFLTRNNSSSEESRRVNRRKGLRKRFLSLTDGISQLFLSDKNESKTVSRKNSVENLSSSKKFSSAEKIGSFSDELPFFLRRESSFSSFRPPDINGLEFETSYKALDGKRIQTPQMERSRKAPSSPPPKHAHRNLISPISSPIYDRMQKAPSSPPPSLDRLKKAPPSPPPRRYSFLLTPHSLPVETFRESTTTHINSSSSFLPKYPTKQYIPPLNLKDPFPSPLPTKKCFNHLSMFSSTSLSSRSPFPSRRILPYNNKNYFSKSPKKFPSSSNASVREKIVTIILEKENGTFGFTLKGGMSINGIPHPLLVTHVKPGGAADRKEVLKAGDRLVAVDGKDLTRCTLNQAQIALQEIENVATIGIRYDICLMDSVRQEGNPLLVEIERESGASLGLRLNILKSQFKPPNYWTKKVSLPSTPAIVEAMKTASIAERCGALLCGDIICSVDGIVVKQDTLEDINQLLESGKNNKVALEVIPMKQEYKARGDTSCYVTSPIYSRRMSNNYETLNKNRTLGHRRRKVESSFSPLAERKVPRVADNHGEISHTEVFRVTLFPEGQSLGFQLNNDFNEKYPTISSIDPGGVVERCRVICVGDRVLSVNGRSICGMNLEEVNHLINSFRISISLDIEVDVADSVIPSFGTFSIKLSKRTCCHGIKLTKRRRLNFNQHFEEIFLISGMTGGSSAHRSGILQVGDQLIAIDNTLLSSLSLEEVENLLDFNSDLVTLRIQKEDSYAVTYSIQLEREKGLLGINATGSEDPLEPIIIGGIVPGSLADQTGALHTGDRILSINNISLRGKTLSEAVQLLQGNDGIVTLKLSRPKLSGAGWSGFHDTPSLSIDSAVESCESGPFDMLQSTNDRLQPKQESPMEIFSSTCGSTVRRKSTSNSTSQNFCRRSWNSSHSNDSGQSDGTDWDKMIADLNQISSTCGLKKKNINNGSSENIGTSQCSDSDLNDNKSTNNLGTDITTVTKPLMITTEKYNEGMYSVSYATSLHRPSSPIVDSIYKGTSAKIFALTLQKDPFYEDFGFSLSDGLYEKGVYVNRIRKGGPAHRSGLLKPFDRILQVNETVTEDFDCCLTVPLIASAEETLYLKVSRPQDVPSLNLMNNLRVNSWFDSEYEVIKESSKSSKDG
ncbi:Glutamate receptor-interacting protein 2 [Armadillidium vulgare]|nr:Glutamate receptor-interacting protein 2 [Armadillidium vulgare]